MAVSYHVTNNQGGGMQATVAHSQGPWTVVVDEQPDVWPVEIRDADGVKLAWVTTNALDQQQANARLIAAAPELLDALRKLLRTYDRTGDHQHLLIDAALHAESVLDCVACQARAVIAKAVPNV